MKTQYGRPCAIACMQSDNSLCGTVKLIPHRDGTLVVADINGLPDTETNFVHCTFMKEKIAAEVGSRIPEGIIILAQQHTRGTQETFRRCLTVVEKPTWRSLPTGFT